MNRSEKKEKEPGWRQNLCKINSKTTQNWMNKKRRFERKREDFCVDNLKIEVQYYKALR